MSDLSFAPPRDPATPAIHPASAEVQECALRAPHLDFTATLIRTARDDRARTTRTDRQIAADESCKLASPNPR